MRGGKREGAGRKKGSLTVRTRKIAERAIAEGKTPLDVMLDNMRHFQQVALDAEAVLATMTANDLPGNPEKPEEQFKALLAEVKKAAGFRQLAHECARDASPYLHARLSSIQHSGEITTRRANEMSDDELAGVATGSSEGTAEAPIDPTQLN
jgi:hypothetical protein